MTRDSSKLCYALLSHYSKLYEQKYGRKPTINRHREKWAMNDVIESVGYDRALALLDYYFKVTNPSHGLSWFFYNFDRLDDMLSKTDEDARRRARIRKMTKKMVEEAE